MRNIPRSSACAFAITRGGRVLLIATTSCSGRPTSFSSTMAPEMEEKRGRRMLRKVDWSWSSTTGWPAARQFFWPYCTVMKPRRAAWIRYAPPGRSMNSNIP